MRLATLRTRALLAVGIATTAFVAAHVRLIYSGNGKVLYWDDENKISIVINATGSDDVADGSHFTAIRNAIAVWNEVGENRAKLKENKNAGEQASTNWSSNNRHLVLFDETNTSGYFPGASGIVAITPISFYTNGEIIDADVLFNGKNFQFTTSGVMGRFDIQDVAAHELGHLLGLDHSGCASATMYPYVDPTVILHRSLSLDDVRGLQHMYPNGNFAKIKGTVTRASDGSLVKGAWVGARDDDGRFAGSILTNKNGRFALQALKTGTYTVYATPLDYPVSDANLTNGHTIHTDFESTVFGDAVATNGSTTEMGTLVVGDDVTLSLGRVADDYPLRVIAGQGNGVMVRGSGLDPGSTLTASDPTVVLSGVTWAGSSVSFTATPPANSPPGHVDLMVIDGSGDTSILCAGLDITPPDPAVTTVAPGIGDSDGGTALTITGTDFNPGARVVIGDTIYKDGATGGCTVVDPTTITLTTKNMIPGIHDVVVIDATGVEGRDIAAFQATATPLVDNVFPEAGFSGGGTTITITGDDFVAGATVEIDGVFQANVMVEDLGTITVVTDPGAPGGPYVLTVQNPAGASADAAFSYAAKPDPVIADVSPDQGSAYGGQTVTVTGSSFTTETRVVFGAGTETGLGGKAAQSVTYVDANTLTVVTPASSSKKKTVLVYEQDTGQAHLVGNAFVFKGNGGGGGGGGGCGSVMPSGPSTWRDVLAGAGWMLVLGLVLVARARRHGALPARG